MYKTPVICPKGSKVVVTQGYKPGIHDSVDLVVWSPNYSPIENSRLSYGAKIVVPLNKWICKQSVWSDKTVGMQGQEAPSGGWVDIQAYYDEKYDIILHFQHLCVCKAQVGDIGSEGQVIGNMGNAGLCYPAPTPEFPFDGTHLHMTVYLRARGQYDNAFTVNPFDYFDFTQWYEGEDSDISIDANQLNWGIKKKGLSTVWEKILYVWKVLGFK